MLAAEKPRIAVMSFNLLSQHYVWKQVFGYLDQAYLDWAHYRFPLINETICQLPCDIMCFQELECLVYQNFWANNFPLKNYQLVYMRKPNPEYWGNKPTEFMDGVGVFINTDRFDILGHREINFGKYVSENPGRFDITNDVSTRLIPRNTVALLVQLHDKLTGKTVYVSNTHLYWLPKFNDVKVIQTKILLNELQRYIKETSSQSDETPHIIMCGDFNSTPDLLVFKLLDNEQISIGSTREFSSHNYGVRIDGEVIHNNVVTNPFHLTPTYGPLLEGNFRDRLDFTSYTKSLTAVLDHIWVSTSQFEVCKVLGKVDNNYSELAAGFPDKQFPSDHIPLVSEISYA